MQQSVEHASVTQEASPIVQAPVTYRQYLNVHTVAQVLNISERMVQSLIASNELPAIHIREKLIRIDPRDLDAYIAARKSGKSEQNGH
jgi:excisionase family DNA binding protein